MLDRLQLGTNRTFVTGKLDVFVVVSRQGNLGKQHQRNRQPAKWLAGLVGRAAVYVGMAS